jgi:hypothetical protein
MVDGWEGREGVVQFKKFLKSSPGISKTYAAMIIEHDL